jgi:hypothetical protein
MQQRMSKPRKKPGNPAFRHQVNAPAPSSEELESRLFELLNPEVFASLKGVKDQQRSLRQRVLTLPVMVAIILSIVYRKVASLSDVLRLLETRGLMWVKPLRVSRQALSQRFNSLPAPLFARLFEQVVERIAAQDPTVASPWRRVVASFGAVWVADASTLAALQKHFGQLQAAAGKVLGGKIMVVVELLSHRPVALWYERNAKTNETHWWQVLLEKLPPGGLLVVDMGFYGFEWFDAFTEAGKFIVTRQKHKVSYRVVQSLSQGRFYRDQLIEMGVHHTHRCRHPMRLVSVRWGGQTYRYLSNVLDPTALSAQQVCELYRRRWRIEDAFLLTKQLVGLSSLWVGGSNGVQLQLYATWIIYAVLNELCAEVSLALSQPLERISVEMVFRSLYFFHQSQQEQPEWHLIPWMVDHQQSMGLVKTIRPRHRRAAARSLDIWADALT